MQNAVAFADNDIALIAWSYGKKPEGCMGFALYRVDKNGNEDPLPSHAVFKGESIKPGQTTEEFPVQKFYWKDPYARLVSEKTGNRKFRYKVVPMQGNPHELKPMTHLPWIISNEIEITSHISKQIQAFFNRGLISTQHVSQALKGKPNRNSLLAAIENQNSRLRADLSGDMVEALTGFVSRAKKSGTIYAALYELGDEELITKLLLLKNRLKIVLSNSVVTKKIDGKNKKIDGNDPARQRLAKSTNGEINRIMPNGHIGHNKFLVYVNNNGPKAVLLGSTNWTPNGLCAQTNNTLIVDNQKLASRYLKYWNQLMADTKNAKGVAKSLQGATFRKWNAKGEAFQIGNDSIQSWFSPNTPKARSKNKNEKRPADMEVLAQRIFAAKHAILFLAFYPGAPCISNWAAQALKKNKNLFVRGCVTNNSASQGFYYELKGTTQPKKVKGQKNPVRQDPRVFAAEALDHKIIPKGWQKELLSAGFAIIHDKILVIDPFAKDCFVAMGSHNLGHKASYDNDENLLMIEGNRELAVAYATHVLDVYDHFSWRYMVNRLGEKGADQSLAEEPQDWLDRYFDAAGEIKNAQLKFWMQATHP
jgi:phosphatidylserine/phosphatidylglycerophosphate/cardiolipin synthase-like enzyme